MEQTELFERIIANFRAACKVIEEAIKQSKMMNEGCMDLLEDTVSQAMKELKGTITQETIEMSLP